MKKMEVKKKELVTKLQAKCKHPMKSVIEAEYMPSESEFFNALPPFRVCTLCGYAEEGWGCGYDKLTCPPTESYDVPIVSRDRAHQSVRGCVRKQERQAV